MDIKEEILKKIDFSLLKKITITTFILGFIAHSYIFYNSIFSHDSLFYVNGLNVSTYISSARFIRIIIIYLKGKFAIPLINGILSLFFISISSYLIIKILDIKNKFNKFLVCCILTINSSYTLLMASYIQDVDMNTFALTLNLLAVYIIQNKEKSIKNIIISSNLIIISLGIYQAYINVALVLELILFIKNILDNKETKSELFKLFKQYSIILCSCIIYYILASVIKQLFSIYNFSTYNKIDGAFAKPFIDYFSSLSIVADSIYDFILTPNATNVTLIKIINILIVIVSLYELIVLIIKNKFKNQTIYIYI